MVAAPESFFHERLRHLSAASVVCRFRWAPNSATNSARRSCRHSVSRDRKKERSG